MADFPTLAEFVERHADLWIIGNSSYRTCTCGGWKDTALSAQFSRASFGAHVQAEWVKDRTIETVAQLDALPVRSVVRDADGDVHEMDDCGFWRAPRYPSILNAVVLPADLLYLPEVDA